MCTNRAVNVVWRATSQLKHDNKSRGQPARPDMKRMFKESVKY